MIKPSILNLDILTEQHRREFIEELRGAVVIITDSEIKSYRDGREVDLGIDAYAPALRFSNDSGVYRVAEDTTDAAGQSEAPEGITDTIKSIWERRRMANHISTITTQSLAPRDIYASRRGQVSA